MSLRWQRWLAVAAGLLAAYAALGFWLLPLLVKDQLPRLAQSQLARQASVGAVEFNPFTLRLAATDLRLAEADGAPLFSVGRLDVQLLWRSIVRRAWTFASVRAAAPAANLVIAPDGRFNVAELLATLSRHSQPASGDSRLPRIVIERFVLEQGRVEMHDRRAGYDNLFSPIDFTLANFSTLPDQADAHTLSAESAGGGTLRWKGTASVNPIHGSGELTLDQVALPAVGVYLKSYTQARVAAGRLSATLPYRFSYADGTFAARLAGAKLALADLALAREGATDSFAALTRLEANGIDADLAGRQATVALVRADGGKLTVRRDAKGDVDLANLMIASAGPAAAPGNGAVAPNNWKLDVRQLLFDRMAIAAIDESVSPPVKLDAGTVRLQLRVAAERQGPDFRLKLDDAACTAADLTVAGGTQPPFKLAEAGFTEGTVDLAARRVVIERLYAQGGQVQVTRDRQGAIKVPGLWPRPAAAAPRDPTPAAAPGAPWSVVARSVELGRFSGDVQDEALRVKVHVNDLGVKVAGAGSDLMQPVKFDAGLVLREGGQLSAQGSVVPESGAVQASVRLQKLALAPLQPLLARHVKLKIAGGQVSAQGRLTSGAGTARSAALRYVGAVSVAGLRLKEDDGDLFAEWRNVSAANLTATFGPNRLEIPELRVVDADAKLGIENDRSFNAARLLVRQPAATSPAPSPATARAAPAVDDAFPVRIRRLRLQNAKLDFTDLSLRPQFSAKIYELNGVVNGLSSDRKARARIELDGRVDEFGSARVRGELNPFAPRNNTDVNVVFKNVDMVPTSPYAMKFAGYRIAEGKISLDLQYKVRDGQLEGANQIVIDKLRLGERVDSPDAFKLPLELAIAILKDSDGRIDLGLPVSGDMNNPQFSYGALIWKAVGTLLTRIVTAPFRAIGRLLGVSGEKLEGVEFTAGSETLAPPEREKLKQIAQLLAKRPQLKLTVPAQYGEAADGAALRARAVRIEIDRRAGVKLQPGEEPGPVDFGNRAVRSAIRELYAARFGEAELDQQKKAAETAAPAPAAAASAAGERQIEAAPGKLALWQRVGKMIQGEPQVADASAFYTALLQRLNQTQPLPEAELARLGTQRADAVLAALKEAGVDASRAAAAAPEKIESAAGKPVSLRLALGAR
ncbi:DUF748 domain-containing protein [Ramlibacter sp.]|uniref:DUF748 domain-containing protein n=1 Tax=Ramlibacter sp. TaxID=1917967 RepID=UPI002C1ECCFD|nr:DUF748 domain-containing protein [Ramlibacter sp.]HWI81749.1 DUF748 domain-containing protein [Ramlibacter sp.]